jgi:uroporphyrinogen decarboxylase
LEFGKRDLEAQMRANVSHRQRIESCLRGGSEKGVPVALWRHFPVDDQQPETLAVCTSAISNSTYDFDLLKVTPASSYMAKDWGIRDVWRGATEGTGSTHTEWYIMQKIGQIFQRA